MGGFLRGAERQTRGLGVESRMALSPTTKALAMARLEAMKARLSHVFEDNEEMWGLVVEVPPTGDDYRFRHSELELVVVAAHEVWVTHCVRQRKKLIERAAKFKLTEIAEAEHKFTGINSVPEGQEVVLAHFYDLLVEHEKRVPRLEYVRTLSDDFEWSFNVINQVPIRGRTLKTVCNRIDAHLQQQFLQEHENIVHAARQLGLVEDVKNVEESAQNLPIVVVPHPQLPDRRTEKPKRRRWLLATALFIFAWGILVGMLISGTR